MAHEPPSGPAKRQRAEAFTEIEPLYTPDQAVAAASRCLFCFDAPCTRACPTGIDVPKFIRQILHQNPVGAAETILGANIFGGSCARACPTEALCEGACVDNTLLSEPVMIGRLQRFACDTTKARGIHFYQAGAETGRRVAIVGSGPAGLTCAHELRKRGHAVTVFEARDMPGGLNTYGIAAYKYDTAFALGEVELVRQIGGIDIRLNSPMSGAGVADLIRDYDAVFLAVGLGPTARLNIPGEDLPGVWEALEFIAQTHTLPLDACQCGRRVLVIGGGNTAVDAATAAVRLGAVEVTIAYRRGEADMPAFRYEYELSLADGIRWEFHAAPVRILGSTDQNPVREDGASLSQAQPQSVGVEFVRTRLAGAGRAARLETIPDSNFMLQADMIIKALGQDPLADLLAAIPGLKTDRGRVLIDSATGATSVARLFAGGDCVSKGGEVVDAVQAGKIAAAGIHATLTPKS